MKRRLSLWKVKVYQDIALRRHNLYELVLYTIYFSFFIAGIVVRFPTSTNMLRQQGAVRDALLDRQKWNDDEKHFEDIHDKEHVWRWLEGPLISSMYGGDEPEPIFRHGNDPNSTLNSAEINAWRLLHSEPKLSGTQVSGLVFAVAPVLIHAVLTASIAAARAHRAAAGPGDGLHLRHDFGHRHVRVSVRRRRRQRQPLAGHRALLPEVPAVRNLRRRRQGVEKEPSVGGCCAGRNVLQQVQALGLSCAAGQR